MLNNKIIFAITLSLVAVALASYLSHPAYAGAFPGANGKFVFSNGNLIFTMNPDGTGRTPVFSASIGGVFVGEAVDPSWSPDGTKIAFATTTLDTIYNGNTPICGPLKIYVMNADGSGLTRLISPVTCSSQYEDYPSWSPDGTKIAYVHLDSSSFSGIYILDGAGDVQLTSNPANADLYPSWSPDGTKIVFSRNSEIYTINADGTGITQLTNDGGFGASDAHPSWSPDGTKIVFTYSFGNVRFVETMNADGTGHTGALVSAPPNLAQYPRWSPDGTKIAFAGGSGILYTMNPDGSGLNIVPELTGWTSSDGVGGFDWGVNPIPTIPLAITAPVDITLVSTTPVSPLLGTATSTGGVAPVTISNNAPVSFAPGTITTVTWKATDSSTPTAQVVTAPQKVTIKTPAQAKTDLSNTITSMNLPKGTQTSLLAPLKNINFANHNASCGKLNGFITNVNGSNLTPTQKAQLIAAANVIKAAIGC